MTSRARVAVEPCAQGREVFSFSLNGPLIYFVRHRLFLQAIYSLIHAFDEYLLSRELIPGIVAVPGM